MSEVTLEYRLGILIRVGTAMVQTAMIGGRNGWSVDYIEVPAGEKTSYRDTLLHAHIKVIKVLPGFIYFES